MALSLLTNLPAFSAMRSLDMTQDALDTSVQRLSSGLRLNRAGDDAAAMGISENIRGDMRSIQQAQRNAFDALSMSQMAEGAMNEIQGIVSRMRELAIHSANGSLGGNERGYIEAEFVELREEITRIAVITEYNGQYLLDGSADSGNGGLDMQVGIHSTSDSQLNMSIERLAASALGSVGGGLTIDAMQLSNAAGAVQALAALDAAITQLSSARAQIGALQNRVSVTLNQLTSTFETLTGANSRIRDVDVAEESGNLAKQQILMQAGIAILGQANKVPSAALRLIAG